jgi:hypothetical protein
MLMQDTNNGHLRNTQHAFTLCRTLRSHLFSTRLAARCFTDDPHEPQHNDDALNVRSLKEEASNCTTTHTHNTQHSPCVHTLSHATICLNIYKALCFAFQRRVHEHEPERRRRRPSVVVNVRAHERKEGSNYTTTHTTTQLPFALCHSFVLNQETLLRSSQTTSTNTISTKRVVVNVRNTETKDQATDKIPRR